jgi:transposase
VGTCPGKDESAEENHSSRSAKAINICAGCYNQAAHAAVKKNGSHFQAVVRRLLPRLGYHSAIWAVAHRLCLVVWKILHEGVRFIEQRREPDRAKKKRAQMLARALRKLGYEVTITPRNLDIAETGMQI